MHKVCSARFLFKNEKLKDDKKILWTIVAQRTTEIPIQNGRQNDQKPLASYHSMQTKMTPVA